MAVSVSISSQTTSQKKAIWAWVVSEKNNKFGSTQSDSAIVGNLIAIHSALNAIPGHLDVIIRTQYSSVAEIINNTNKTTKNPVVLKIFQLIKLRSGTVNAIVFSSKNVTENDRRAYKMTTTISGVKKKPAAGSLLSPTKTTKVKVAVTPKKATPTKKRAAKEFLITGLEDDYDDTPLPKGKPAAEKPVLCESCNGPINPLTYECFCSN